MADTKIITAIYPLANPVQRAANGAAVIVARGATVELPSAIAERLVAEGKAIEAAKAEPKAKKK